MRRRVRMLACAAALTTASVAAAPQQAFDHSYAGYAALLARHVHDGRVDYKGLVADRAALAAVVSGFGAVDPSTERGWPREQRLAFWINAYNLFTLQAIVDHYPIRAGWLTFGPRNSIRRIPGVWDRLTWQVAERQVTLDDIEHRILRPEEQGGVVVVDAGFETSHTARPGWMGSSMPTRGGISPARTAYAWRAGRCSSRRS